MGQISLTRKKQLAALCALKNIIKLIKSTYNHVSAVLVRRGVAESIRSKYPLKKLCASASLRACLPKGMDHLNPRIYLPQGRIRAICVLASRKACPVPDFYRVTGGWR